MKQSLLSLLLLVSLESYGQLIMQAEGVKVENACKTNNIQFLMTGKAKPVESIEAIEQRLNETLSFARENPNFKASAAV